MTWFALNLSSENFMLCNQILELLIPPAGAVVHKIVQRVHEQVIVAAMTEFNQKQERMAQVLSIFINS
ncbi:hypothetical protein [Comamonas aquatilis]|uniref:hypothetical protein n=1 Tax=Comamonas aquatilis TaxID=1778406 RepID=UPI0039F14B1F